MVSEKNLVVILPRRDVNRNLFGQCITHTIYSVSFLRQLFNVFHSAKSTFTIRTFFNRIENLYFFPSLS